MDKRLIDADKLLDKARVGGNITTYSEISEWVESGILAPDPIPLPTIKPGDTRQLLHNTINVMTDEQVQMVAKSLSLEVSHD